MTDRPIEYYLDRLEKYRIDRDLTRGSMAKELAIPYGTYRNWYRDTEKKVDPSARYKRWIKAFLECRDVLSPDRWIHEDGPAFLNELGVHTGQTVTDFGSRNGDYTLMLARAVGHDGTVYAIDKDKEVLGEVMGRACGEGFGNIDGIVAKGSEPPTKLPLPDTSVDAGWFSDVLHDGYFEEDDHKQELLADVRRVLREDAFIAVHPVHMDKQRLKKVIRRSEFNFVEERRHPVLFHGDEFHQGYIYRYVKSTQ